MVNLLEVINTKFWYINQEYAFRLYPIVTELVKRGEFLTNKLSDKGSSRNADVLDNVAVLPIHGTMTKRGGLSAHGTRDLIGAINFANQDDNINSILLDIESNGGTVDGTADLGLAIKNSKKPVVSYIDSVAASAAYWAASQSDEIIVSPTNNPQVGSIGALYLHTDQSKFISKNIGSVKIVRAPQSTDKAKINAIEPLTDNLEFEIKKELEEITDSFIGAVKEGRNGRLNTGDENIFTGKMYNTNQALKMGMVDREGTFMEAVESAYNLGKLVKETESVLN